MPASQVCALLSSLRRKSSRTNTLLTRESWPTTYEAYGTIPALCFWIGQQERCVQRNRLNVDRECHCVLGLGVSRITDRGRGVGSSVIVIMHQNVGFVVPAVVADNHARLCRVDVA